MMVFQDMINSGKYNFLIDTVLPNIGLNGDILTRLSDVEDETNGLITYDRPVLKVSPELMHSKAEEIYKAFKNS